MACTYLPNKRASQPNNWPNKLSALPRTRHDIILENSIPCPLRQAVGRILWGFFRDRGCLGINITSYQYRDSQYKDKTVVRQSYLYNGIHIHAASLYWDRTMLARYRGCAVSLIVSFVWRCCLWRPAHHYLVTSHSTPFCHTHRNG